MDRHQPMLPNKPGVPRVNDRRVLNGIFWVLRSGAPWRDLPETYRPCTTCYNRFVSLAAGRRLGPDHGGVGPAHDAAVQMIDIVCRARAPTWGLYRGKQGAAQHMGRSRGGLTSKVHAVVDANGLPVRLDLTPGEAHDNRLCPFASSRIAPADDGAGGSWLRCRLDQSVRQPAGCLGQHTSEAEPQGAHLLQSPLYRARNLVERFFNKIKQCRRIATRYDKLAANYLAFIKPASIRLWLRTYVSTP
jgi:transposase